MGMYTKCFDFVFLKLIIFQYFTFKLSFFKNLNFGRNEGQWRC